MAARKRTREQLERTRALIARLILKGESQVAISQQLGMTTQMVNYDLAAIRKEWRQSAVRDLDEAFATELAKLDLLEAEYWREWERSKKPRKKETAKVVEGTSGATGNPINREEASTTEEEREGNPVFLQGVLACIDRRIKLLGLDTPVEQRHTFALVKLYKDVNMEAI